VFFCSTMPTASRSFETAYSRTSRPSILRLPSVTSYSRGISCTSDDFAEPVPPMTPSVCPGRILRQMSESANSFAVSLYLKDTWSNSTAPLSTSPSQSPSAMPGASSITSSIRPAEVIERLSIRNTFEIIISEFSICNT